MDKSIYLGLPVLEISKIVMSVKPKHGNKANLS